MNATESLFHVTVLSNFARGFDKYSRAYSKARIPESTYPDRFFLLRRDELEIGIKKATPLLHKLEIQANRLIVLETSIDESTLQDNARTGLGRFVQSNRIKISGLYDVDRDENARIQLRPLAVEEAKITKGYRLPAKFVIHTVGPVWDGGNYGEPELLASCYRNCFALAREKAIKTIAFPAISCGVYGYPIHDAVQIAVREARAALMSTTDIERIIFACFTDEVFEAYRASLQSEQP